MTTTATTDTTISFSPQAVETIQRMADHVSRLGAFYGGDSPEACRAAASLARSLAAVIGLGGRITKDSDLGLYGASFIAYGVVFHGTSVPEPYAEIDGAPMPGEWSVHS